MAMNLKDAVAQLESGEWLSLRVFQANLAQGKGGKVLQLAKCKIARRQSGGTDIKSASSHTKNPNHNFNFTRNVELQNTDIITIHPILITHINNVALL